MQPVNRNFAEPCTLQPVTHQGAQGPQVLILNGESFEGLNERALFTWEVRVCTMQQACTLLGNRNNDPPKRRRGGRGGRGIPAFPILLPPPPPPPPPPFIGMVSARAAHSWLPACLDWVRTARVREGQSLEKWPRRIGGRRPTAPAGLTSLVRRALIRIRIFHRSHDMGASRRNENTRSNRK